MFGHEIGVQAEQIMDHLHLAVTTGTGPDADRRHTQPRSDRPVLAAAGTSSSTIAKAPAACKCQRICQATGGLLQASVPARECRSY